MNIFERIFATKTEKTGRTRTVKLIWFQDGVAPLRLYPGQSYELDENTTPIVRITDEQQEEVSSTTADGITSTSWQEITGN